MSFKRFISGVCAFAVAVTAFAAVTVTASAKDYSESITLGAGNGYNIASYNNSGIATAKTGITYAALRADLRELTDIGNASSVTVEFDAATYSGNVVVFSFGDAVQRTTIADGSGNFKTGGLAMYFGSVNGSDLKAYDKTSGQSKNLGSSFFGKIIHAKVRFNKDAGTYDYEISQGSNKISQTGVATDIGNLTYVEAFTKTASAQMMFNNIKVSYTVPTAPTAGTPSEVQVPDNQGNDGVYARAFTCDITYDGIAIKNVKVDVEGSNEGSQMISFSGISGDVSIGIILASKDASKIAGVTPTVTVNAE